MVFAFAEADRSLSAGSIYADCEYDLPSIVISSG